MRTAGPRSTGGMCVVPLGNERKSTLAARGQYGYGMKGCRSIDAKRQQD